MALELGYGFLKFNPFVPASFVYPENNVLTYLSTHAGINRFWGYGTARFESNLNAQYHLYSTDGTDPLNLRWYNQFNQASKDGYLARVFTRSTRSDAELAHGYGERDLPENMYRLRIMDLLGVRYILDRTENPKDNTTFDSIRFKPLTTLPSGYTIFENKLVYPRAFLVGAYKTYDSIDSFEQQFFSKSFDPRQTVLLPKDTAPITTSVATIGDATILSYKPDEIIIQTSNDAPQILFLSDTYAPGWNATIDGINTPVLLANYAFRAIAVPVGTHKIVFLYRPASIVYGGILSVFGVIILTVYLILMKKYF
jgi:hypothetical protein